MVGSHVTHRSSPDPTSDFVRVQTPVLGNLGMGIFGGGGGAGTGIGTGGPGSAVGSASGVGPGGMGMGVNLGGAPSVGYETSEFCEVKTHSYSEPVSVDELEAILRDWNIEDGEAQVLGQALGT